MIFCVFNFTSHIPLSSTHTNISNPSFLISQITKLQYCHKLTHLFENNYSSHTVIDKVCEYSIISQYANAIVSHHPFYSPSPFIFSSLSSPWINGSLSSPWINGQQQSSTSPSIIDQPIIGHHHRPAHQSSTSPSSAVIGNVITPT